MTATVSRSRATAATMPGTRPVAAPPHTPAPAWCDPAGSAGPDDGAPFVAAVVAAARWDGQAAPVTATLLLSRSLREIVSALAGAWGGPRRAPACRCGMGRDDLRPSAAQALLARQLVAAA